MKKIFQEPSVECVRICTEEVANSTGGVGGNTGNITLSTNPFG